MDIYLWFVIIFSFVQVRGISITLEGSSQYVVPGQLFSFTCRFFSNNTVTTVTSLNKNGIRSQTVQQYVDKCYNIIGIPELCDPLFCSCSKQGDIFTATWTFSSINDTLSTVEVVNKPRINLLYGPETVTLNLSSKHYSTTEKGTVPDITCSTDCKPNFNYRWTKDGQVTSHGSGRILSLRIINRNYIDLDLYTMVSTVVFENTQDIHLACDARGNPSDIVFSHGHRKSVLK